jgi:hypothetical protein
MLAVIGAVDRGTGPECGRCPAVSDGRAQHWPIKKNPKANLSIFLLAVKAELAQKCRTEVDDTRKSQN